MLINVDLEPSVAGVRMGLEKEGKSLYFNNNNNKKKPLGLSAKLVKNGCFKSLYDNLSLQSSIVFILCMFFVKKQNGGGIFH